jgi:DNA repair exonuclease SbcCD ATPase subunit
VCDAHTRTNELRNCPLCHGSHSTDDHYAVNKAFELHLKVLRTRDSVDTALTNLGQLKTVQQEPHIHIADFFAKLIERVHAREKEVTDSVHSYFDRMVFEINQIKTRYKELESDPNGHLTRMRLFDLARFEDELEGYKKESEARVANLKSQLAFVQDGSQTERQLKETAKRVAEIEKSLTDQLNNFLDKDGFILTPRSNELAKCEEFCGKLIVRERVCFFCSD